MQQYDLGEPAMKATAVGEVLQYVVRIQDRVERLEVGKAVAEAFRIPDSVVFEQLRLTPGRPAVRPAVRTQPPVQKRSLSASEKQLIHGLLQDRDVGRRIEPFVQAEFLSEAWSLPVLKGLMEGPDRNIEQILESLDDKDLQKEVRAAILEPFGRVSAEQALASIAQLYDAHLVKTEREIREQLKAYGSGAAPPELVKRQMEIAAEKSRVRGLRP
jgi:hypothetical protein